MEERIVKVLESVKPDVKGSLDKNFINDGVLDSLDIMRLIAALEEEFNIEVDPEDVITDNFETIAAIKTLVEKCQ
jgi:acyl carrier protein